MADDWGKELNEGVLPGDKVRFHTSLATIGGWKLQPGQQIDGEKEVLFALRCDERNDVRAMAQVRAALVPAGLVEDKTREITCTRNGGLWQYRVPVIEKVTA